LKIEELVEHEDGSATVIVEMTLDEKALLIESAIRIGLIEGIKLVEEKRLKELDEQSNTSVGNP
jgi:hypothetical protein